MAQYFFYRPSNVAITFPSSITVDQGTTPWIVSDPAVETSTASIDSKTPTQGQKTMANSSPVVIASDQSPVAVTGPLTDAQLRATPVPVSISSGISNPLPVTDAAAEASLAAINGKLNSLGQKTSANSVPVVLASDQSTVPTSTTNGATQATLLAFSNKSASAFVNVPFDETVLTYVGATTRIATVVYKLATVTVQTLTLSYDGSDRLVDVLKS